jgi:hypothetical protein
MGAMELNRESRAVLGVYLNQQNTAHGGKLHGDTIHYKSTYAGTHFHDYERVPTDRGIENRN